MDRGRCDVDFFKELAGYIHLNDRELSHQAIHGAESIFWIILFFMTRANPKGADRQNPRCTVRRYSMPLWGTRSVVPPVLAALSCFFFCEGLGINTSWNTPGVFWNALQPFTLLLFSLAQYPSACQASVSCSQLPSMVAQPWDHTTQGYGRSHTITCSIGVECETTQWQLGNLSAFPKPTEKMADWGCWKDCACQTQKKRSVPCWWWWYSPVYFSLAVCH